MPSEFGPDEATSDLRIAPSPFLDFQFGLFLLMKHCLDPEKWVPPWVRDVSDANPEIVGRLLAFWDPEGLSDHDGRPYREWGELLTASWKSGQLFAPDPERALEAAGAELARGFAVPQLDSEPPGVRELIQVRVDWLKTHPAELDRLMALLQSTWQLMLPYWDEFGRDASNSYSREIAARATPGVDLRTLVRGNSFLHKEAFQGQIAGARSRGELVLVPLGLAGGGQFYWSFPGLAVVGAGVDSAEREARRRERTDRAANKLKVLSDPTRVAILCELLKWSAHHPATVTELASQFGLSQPTVSVHVKMLREAGLTSAEREGNQVQYHTEAETIRRYMSEALDDILQKVEGADVYELPVGSSL